MTPAQAKRHLVAVQAERGRRSLRWFVEHAWPLVEATPFQPSWHIDHVCAHLEAVTRGEIRKLVINVPPGSGKSLLVCVFWSAWMWIVNPSLGQLFSSFDIDLTSRDAQRVRNILTSEWFQERWGSKFHVDGDEPLKEYKTYGPDGKDLGGFRFATSVEGKATGKHPDIKVIDDPTKPKEATKENLQKTKEWWQNTMRSRARNQATVATVLIMQRLDEDDLAGYFLAEGGWEHVSIPLEYDPDNAYETKWGKDPRTEVGESFCESRFPKHVIQEIKKDTPDVGVWSSQWQQNPTPASGIIFEKPWLHHEWTTLPPNGIWYHSWDMAFKGKETSDWVVGLCAVYANAKFYLVAVTRKRIAFKDTVKEFEGFTAKWPKAFGKLVEAKANGPAIMDQLEDKIPGIVPIEVSDSKISRAMSTQPVFAAGDVLLPGPGAMIDGIEIDRSWVLDYRDEVTKFPRGKHDDQVDATTQLIAHVIPLGSGSYSQALEGMRKLMEQVG